MIIGIDLGTTYSVAAYLDENNIPQIITNAESEGTTPSVVFVDGDNVYVGKAAKLKGILQPEKVCRCIKMNMGNRQVVMRDEENDYTPEMISAMILKKIITDSERRLEEKIEGAVVTVPTYFDDTQRMATQNALEGLGVPLVGMVDEPTAAAYYYCYQNAVEQTRILVYDFGGGTFDATLLEINGNNITILAKGGEHEAGGAYFDEAIRDYVIDEFLMEKEVNLREDKYAKIREEILNDAEDCKKALTYSEESGIMVRCPEGAGEIIVSRDVFNDLIDNMVYRTILVIEEMLDKKGLTPADVDKVLLVGGSSRIPYVREQLQKKFGEGLSEKLDPEKAVAYGAAVYADIIKDEINETLSERKLNISDVCIQGIGIIRRDPNNLFSKINDVIIEPNTPIPASAEKVYELSIENQKSIMLELTEGEFQEVEFVRIISVMDIPIPQDKSLKRGTEVSVQLKVNQNQLIEVYLHIPSIDLHMEYKIPRLDNMTDEEIKAMSGLIASKNIR